MTDTGNDPTNDEAWSKLHPVHQERLKKAVMLLAETHGRKLSPAAITVWCRALAPFAEGQLVWSVRSGPDAVDRIVQNPVSGSPGASPIRDTTTAHRGPTKALGPGSNHEHVVARPGARVDGE